MNNIQLVDDGTLDTVISVNGVEFRYNFEGEDIYSEFVKWCFEDAEEQYMNIKTSS